MQCTLCYFILRLCRLFHLLSFEWKFILSFYLFHPAFKYFSNKLLSSFTAESSHTIKTGYSFYPRIIHDHNNCVVFCCCCAQVHEPISLKTVMVCNKISEIFPSRWTVLVFLCYILLFICQGKLNFIFIVFLLFHSSWWYDKYAQKKLFARKEILYCKSLKVAFFLKAVQLFEVVSEDIATDTALWMVSATNLSTAGIPLRYYQCYVA